MQTNVTSHEITGSITYFAVTVEVDDGDAIHELDVIVVEGYEGNSDSVEYSIDDDSIEWITEVPDDTEKRDKIMSLAKESAGEHIKNR